MGERQCFHCKQWVAAGEAHDCWTTTEAALTDDLAPDLAEAWERLRETACEFGDQRIYASHNSIMFSRRSCYFFVRPKRTFLELCIFLGRVVTAPQVRRVAESSRTKFVHFIKVTHRDQVEAPITDWLREAFEYVERPAPHRVATETSKQKVAARVRPTGSTRKHAATARRRTQK